MSLVPHSLLILSPTWSWWPRTPASPASRAGANQRPERQACQRARPTPSRTSLHHADHPRQPGGGGRRNLGAHAVVALMHLSAVNARH